MAQPEPSAGRSTTTATRTASNHSSIWRYGLIVGVLLWLPVAFLSGPGASGAVDRAATLVGFGLWAFIPLCGYLDIRHVRANSDWEPETLEWLFVFSIVLFVQALASLAYLYRRRTVLGGR